MPIQRIDIERALDELISQEEGMRFQGLAVVLGKRRWPELIARQRKKDFGLDAYAPAIETRERVGKGLAASITPTLGKVRDDAETAKENYPDLATLLFVTPAKISNAMQRQWKEAIRDEVGLELLFIEREEIIALMMMPENASLCGSHLGIPVGADSTIARLIAGTRRAAAAVTQRWVAKTKGSPLIDLAAVRLDPNGAESNELLSLEQIDRELSQSGRMILEGPAGRGKTTTLIQLAQRARTAGTPFVVELPAWTMSGKDILEFIAGMPSFRAEGIGPAHLARVQQAEPFLFLLNGWNEIAESGSARANYALRELERNFPTAGIIVATRTHHLTPPLPGAVRLRLLRLGHAQRTEYLVNRLKEKSVGLRTRIENDPSLDDLTRTPFILSEVASLFEARTEIPSTKIGVLAQVVGLHEQRDEHCNALQAAPVFGKQTEYLNALATKMTHSGAVALYETDARAAVAGVAGDLKDRGQVTQVEPAEVLGNLTAHHLLERGEYPETVLQFEHQQFQEYYATIDVRARLLGISDNDHDLTDQFAATYVNESAWAEPLYMIAEALAEQTGANKVSKQDIRAGVKLVEMALGVDLVFAGEIARLCGSTIWKEVRTMVGERFRAVHKIPERSFQQQAVAAMLATGSDDFIDIILPLLSGQDRQSRLGTYRLWPDFQLSSLGPNWRKQVRSWSEEARTNFVWELLHHRFEGEIVSFAVEDNSVAVKKAAVSGLTWIGSKDELTRVIESLDVQTFEEVAVKDPDHIPQVMRPRVISAMRKFVAGNHDHSTRLQTALKLIKLGETDLAGVVKDAMAALPNDDGRRLALHFVRPALEMLHDLDPAWASRWVAVRIADGALYGHEDWLPFATKVPDDLVEEFLHRIETEDLGDSNYNGMISVIAARADAKIAPRVFAKLRESRRKIDAEPDMRHEVGWQLIRQLEDTFRGLSDDHIAIGVLSSVECGNPLDINVAAHLVSRVARPDQEPLRISDADLKARLRAYLKASVELVLSQDDYNGEEKADLASSIAQVGEPEDMADLARLIRADVERVRKGRAARAAGDRGPRGDGAIMTQAFWNVTAVTQLDRSGAEKLLIDLLSEPEYSSEAAAAMASEFLPKAENPFVRKFRYDLMWSAREGQISPPGDELRRVRFAVALNAEIRRRRQHTADERSVAGVKKLAEALAAIDGRGAADTVFEAIAIPGQWVEYTDLEAAKRLLSAGVVLPVRTVLGLVDSVLERTEHSMSNPDRVLVRQVLELCPFVDDTSAGIAKMREVIEKRRLRGHELREIVTALGESRSDPAVDLLSDLVSDPQNFQQCEANFINAFATLDTSRSRRLR